MEMRNKNIIEKSDVYKCNLHMQTHIHIDKQDFLWKTLFSPD